MFVIIKNNAVIFKKSMKNYVVKCFCLEYYNTMIFKAG